MENIDYKKVFSKLSHIKALSYDQKFDQIVQNLITHTLNQNIDDEHLKNENDVSNRIKDIYGISIRKPIILSNIDKLLSSGSLIRELKTKTLRLAPMLAQELNNNLKKVKELEQSVKFFWFKELSDSLESIDKSELEKFWAILQKYLCSVFEQHGIQTLTFLNPLTKLNGEEQNNLEAIIQRIYKESNSGFSIDIVVSSINEFIVNADELRTTYLTQLVDATFTSFALTSDTETVSFLNKRYNDLLLFLDTNFIFGVLDLHKNNEDTSAIEILEEVKKNRLPFRLMYHPETLAEFKRAFDARAMHVRATKWSKETSRVAVAVGGLSPVEKLFHSQNIEDEIDPIVFLEKYDHVDLILKDLGLSEYIPNSYKSEEHVEVENDIEAYQSFYDAVPYRKPKTYLGFKHDLLVLREVRALNPKKSKFLESRAFFISSDFILGKFEKSYYKKDWEINYVVNPSVFLQLIRPFIENDYSSNKRFIDTFSIPDFRSFQIDYTSTRSKTLQILNDNYHATSFQTKVNILRDQVLLEKLEKANDNNEKFIELVENHIAFENQVLSAQKKAINNELQNLKDVNSELIQERDATKKAELKKESELNILREDLNSIRIELQNTKLKQKFDDDLEMWMSNKKVFVTGKLNEKTSEYQKASRYCITPIIITLIAATLIPIGSIFFDEIKHFISTQQISIWIVSVGLLLLYLLWGYTIIYKVFIIDYKRVALGLKWIGTLGFSKQKKNLLSSYEEDAIKEYEIKNPKPELRYVTTKQE